MGADIKRIKAGVRAALIADSIYSVSMAVLVYFSAPSMPSACFFFRRCDVNALLWQKPQLSLLHCFLMSRVVHDLHLPEISCRDAATASAEMGGVAELLARLVVSIAAMKAAYPTACVADPAAWMLRRHLPVFSYLYDKEN